MFARVLRRTHRSWGNWASQFHGNTALVQHLVCEMFPHLSSMLMQTLAARRQRWADALWHIPSAHALALFCSGDNYLCFCLFLLFTFSDFMYIWQYFFVSLVHKYAALFRLELLWKNVSATRARARTHTHTENTKQNKIKNCHKITFSEISKPSGGIFQLLFVWKLPFWHPEKYSVYDFFFFFNE